MSQGICSLRLSKSYQYETERRDKRVMERGPKKCTGIKAMNEGTKEERKRYRYNISFLFLWRYNALIRIIAPCDRYLSATSTFYVSSSIQKVGCPDQSIWSTNECVVRKRRRRNRLWELLPSLEMSKNFWKRLTRYQKVFGMWLFLNSCELMFTFSPFFYKLWLFLFEVTLMSPIALQQNSNLGLRLVDL